MLSRRRPNGTQRGDKTDAGGTGNSVKQLAGLLGFVLLVLCGAAAAVVALIFVTGVPHLVPATPPGVALAFVVALLCWSATVVLLRVAKYMHRHPRPPSQTWRTSLTNHASRSWLRTCSSCRPSRSGCSSYSSSSRTTVDGSCTWPSPSTRLRLGTAQQPRNAFPEHEAPGHLLHDCDAVFRGREHRRRHGHSGGSYRADHHGRPSAGRIVATPQIGGLHHRYDRAAA